MTTTSRLHGAVEEDRRKHWQTEALQAQTKLLKAQGAIQDAVNVLEGYQDGSCAEQRMAVQSALVLLREVQA